MKIESGGKYFKLVQQRKMRSTISGVSCTVVAGVRWCRWPLFRIESDGMTRVVTACDALCNKCWSVNKWSCKVKTRNFKLKHNRSEMVAVLGPYEALPYYIHTYKVTWEIKYPSARSPRKCYMNIIKINRKITVSNILYNYIEVCD
jgi:hypothetical protein